VKGTGRRRGFTLTEILLAVGILGIGLTMVASVFPVAVDQTRRSTDATNAALCARSVAATLRALRPKFVNECRNYFAKASSSLTNAPNDKPAEYDGPTGITPSIPRIPYSTGTTITAAALKSDLREYNPNSFLYEQGTGTLAAAKFRQYTEGVLPTLATGETYEKKRPYTMPQWYMGNYVPVIYISPMTTLLADRTSNTSKSNRSNPFRITIVVFRSRGSSGTGALGSTLLHPRNKSFSEKNLAPGEYILDRNRCAGECYMIDSTSWISGSGSTAVWKVLPGPLDLAASTTPGNPAVTPPTLPTIPTASTSGWYVMPGAVAVYHTVIGD
jgi:prepilin-type N-terminal cleavage/methylation domain-containing protein